MTSTATGVTLSSKKGSIWQPWFRFVHYLKAGLYTTCTDDLIAAATELFRGENQLGKVFTDFMLAIEPMDYETYMRAIADVQFVTVAK